MVYSNSSGKLLFNWWIIYVLLYCKSILFLLINLYLFILSSLTNALVFYIFIAANLRWMLLKFSLQPLLQLEKTGKDSSALKLFSKVGIHLKLFAVHKFQRLYPGCQMLRLVRNYWTYHFAVFLDTFHIAATHLWPWNIYTKPTLIIDNNNASPFWYSVITSI